MERNRSWPARGSQKLARAVRRQGSLDWLVRERQTGIPNLQADDRVGVRVDDTLGHEAGADGRRDLSRGEGALDIPRHQRRLADALGAEDDDFCLERRHALLACLFVSSLWRLSRSPGRLVSSVGGKGGGGGGKGRGEYSVEIRGQRAAEDLLLRSRSVC